MIDPFLDEIFVTNAIAAAVSRNMVYATSCTDAAKQDFRQKFAEQLRTAADSYATKVADDEHCATIGAIAGGLSAECSTALCGGRLRYGTVQKALNLYLKFLWRSGAIAEPPHCPVDGVVLRAAGISDAWTKSDCERRYRIWIATLRENAGSLSLAEFEYQVWLDSRRS